MNFKKSKFYIYRPFKERVSDFFGSIFFWKSRNKGIITTSRIGFNEIRAVFFPLNFYEKYRYLGYVPWKADGEIFKAMEPLVIFMDHKAKPKWCPRWFLRFLHLFGSDNSIVRVRNFRLHNLSKKLTKGIMIWDFKTKWDYYDLRISVSGDDQIQNMAEDIEVGFYERGKRKGKKEKEKKK
jgi:hypothetical protein